MNWGKTLQTDVRPPSMPSGADEQAREAARRASREKERKRVRTEADRYRATQLRINVAAALGQVGGDLPERLRRATVFSGGGHADFHHGSSLPQYLSCGVEEAERRRKVLAREPLPGSASACPPALPWLTSLPQYLSCGVEEAEYRRKVLAWEPLPGSASSSSPHQSLGLSHFLLHDVCVPDARSSRERALARAIQVKGGSLAIFNASCDEVAELVWHQAEKAPSAATPADIGVVDGDGVEADPSQEDPPVPSDSDEEDDVDADGEGDVEYPPAEFAEGEPEAGVGQGALGETEAGGGALGETEAEGIAGEEGGAAAFDGRAEEGEVEEGDDEGDPSARGLFEGYFRGNSPGCDMTQLPVPLADLRGARAKELEGAGVAFADAVKRNEASSADAPALWGMASPMGSPPELWRCYLPKGPQGADPGWQGLLSETADPRCAMCRRMHACIRDGVVRDETAPAAGDAAARWLAPAEWAENGDVLVSALDETGRLLRELILHPPADLTQRQALAARVLASDSTLQPELLVRAHRDTADMYWAHFVADVFCQPPVIAPEPSDSKLLDSERARLRARDGELRGLLPSGCLQGGLDQQPKALPGETKPAAVDVTPGALKRQLGAAASQFQVARLALFEAMLACIACGWWQACEVATSWRYQSMGRGGTGASAPRRPDCASRTITAPPPLPAAPRRHLRRMRHRQRAAPHPVPPPL